MTKGASEEAPFVVVFIGKFGGATRSRTGLDGFAIRCITDLLSRPIRRPGDRSFSFDKKGKPGFPFFKLERETRFELATSTLARLRSTN